MSGHRDQAAAYMASREAWDRAYDEAMQWRDWQTCEQMIEEREQAEWWTPEEAMLDE